jgi:transposase InsO family protein
MSDLRWKKKTAALAAEADLSRSTFYAVGSRFHRRDKPAILCKHKWILTATDYFTKWIEAIPTKQATDAVIIQFLETNILSRFGCPVKIVTDNAVTFKSKRMEKFFQDYNITLGHSMTYYPQGNGLAESSNKSLTRIIKRLLQENKRAWHKNLIYALWEDRVTTKKSISTSPFQIVYGADAIFPTSLGPPVRKLLQEQEAEPNAAQRRINQLIHT